MGRNQKGKTAMDEILLVFKTHLDLGFTDSAENVISKYCDEYIPKAIDIANALKDTDTPFIWTTGSRKQSFAPAI